MRFDEKKLGLLALIAYIVAFLFLAVINRDSGSKRPNLGPGLICLR